MKNKTYFTIAEDCPPALETFIKTLPEQFPLKGRTIHKARNEIKVYDIEGIKVNLKKFCVSPIINRIFYSYGIRTPKAVSSYNNAIKMRERGLDTPKPYAYILQKKCGILNYSYLITAQDDSVKPIGHQCKDRDIIKALAKYTADMHEKGMMHKDYSPGNILYAKDGENYRFALVDINRFVFQNKPINRKTACTSIMRAFIYDEELELFTANYAEYRNADKQSYIDETIFLRHARNKYDTFKRWLKNIPGAKLLIGKPIK